jgi:hypothetical protein
VVDVLFAHLASGGHELVLFDVNRLADARSLLISSPGPLTQQLLEMSGRTFALTVITNASPGTLSVQERRAEPGVEQLTARMLDLEWPSTVFSLSHVALPFAPDDPLYGYAAVQDRAHVQLGRLEVRGENGVLAIPTWMLTRLRSNPFYSYLSQRVEALVAPSTVQEQPAAAGPPDG